MHVSLSSVWSTSHAELLQVHQNVAKMQVREDKQIFYLYISQFTPNWRLMTSHL